MSEALKILGERPHALRAIRTLSNVKTLYGGNIYTSDGGQPICNNPSQCVQSCYVVIIHDITYRKD